MLRHSFIFIPGIGRHTENRLWQRRILTWNDLRSGLGAAGLNRRQQAAAREYLSRAEEALARQQAAFFARHLPRREHWRAYAEFRARTVFLDLETTGLSPYYDRVTVIGCYDAGGARAFVRGADLEAAADYLRGFAILVTFNGTLFDLSFLRREFPGILLPPIHLDLRYLLKGLGLGGPLKRIEARLGISRPETVRDIDGHQAVVLWRRFQDGDRDALDRLLLYNRCDTVNLARLMDLVYALKAREAGFSPDPAFSSGPAPDALPYLPDAFGRALPGKPGPAAARASGRHPLLLAGLIRQIEARGRVPAAVGIDLAATEARETGFCLLRGEEADLARAATDEEIMRLFRAAGAELVSIDAPLSLPAGRCCTSDSCPCRVHGLTRECERVLVRRGIRVYPCLIEKMRGLTLRGMRLAERLRREGKEVIECYPGAAQDILGWPRKRADLEGLHRALVDAGVRLPARDRWPSHHQLDALTAALVGYFYLAGRYEALGNAGEGYLIVPLP